MRRLLAGALCLAGLAYLALKAEYLTLDSPAVLKAFIVSPSAVLFVAAALTAFADARRRTGASLLAIGLITLFWLSKEPLPGGGWTFYTPYNGVEPLEFPRYLKGPNPYLAAAATLLPFLGMGTLAHRSLLGSLLLAGSMWCAFCFSPSSALGTFFGMPRRYSYYYAAPQGVTLIQDRSDAVLPILLGLAGAAMTMGAGRVKGGGNDVPAAQHGDRS